MKLSLALFFVLGIEVTGAPTPVEFNRDARPILSDKCYSCHGPDFFLHLLTEFSAYDTYLVLLK
jgi:hypothetical protein